MTDVSGLPAFLTGGGLLAEAISTYDWSKTALGPINTWPTSVTTTVGLILRSPVPMVTLWLEPGVMIYNDAYSVFAGGRHPRLLGSPVREGWPEVADFNDHVMTVGLAGGVLSYKNQELTLLRSGAPEQVWMNLDYSPVIGESGKPIGVIAIVVETSLAVRAERELRRSEAEIRVSEERFQLALSAGNSIGTWDWDVVADRVVADARFASLYNVDPEFAKAGAPIAEFFGGIHPLDSERVQSEVARAIETGVPFVSEYRLVQPNGTIKWIVAHGRCIQSPDGRPLRFPGASFDITDRKLAEERLRELNLDLERQVVERSSERGTTWHVSPHLLSVIDLNNGKFVRVNPAWKEVLGWSETEMVGASYGDFLHPDDLASSQAAFETVMRGIPVLDFENRYRDKNGTYHWLVWVAVPEEGRLYSTARDISAEKKRAEALAAAEDSLRQAQKMEAVGQLTGGLAHDFNNLLTGIGGSLQMLQMRMAQGRLDTVDRYISVAQGAVKRAASLTHRLLAFSRRQTLDAKPTNVNRLISGMEDLIRRTVGPAVHIEVVGAVGVWPTLVDPNQLENALLNLCINAKDAMPQGGRLTIETANKWLDERESKQRDLPAGQYVSLCVTDTGTGMTPDVIAHAFDPFFTTKPFGEGTGLGLSMIYGFARQSGGQIRIYSELGKGTTMCLYAAA